MNSEVKEICPLSHLSLAHPHVLHQKPGGNTESGCFSCGQRRSFVTSRGIHYHCTTCDVEFHRVCHKFPRKLRHPYHPQHPLTFTFRDNETGIISDTNTGESLWLTLFSGSIIISDPNKSGSVKDKCSWCTKDIECNWFYRCSLCSFSLDLSCYKNIPLFQTVEKPKSHHHSLVFYARPLLTPCDACGLVNVLDPTYACFQCNYMVHQSCIDLPRVIKITRHQHRLSHTPYVGPVTFSPCRICYKPVDIKYGQYSCDQEDCTYVFHSKCATRENVWDGKELEWEPEKSDEIISEDIIPFIKVGSRFIKHFSHEHLLKLVKYDGVRDGEKQCLACTLPINSLDFYDCLQCDFFLHEVCAGLLRKIDHALHVHPLVLDLNPDSSCRYSQIGCSVCSRKFSGFKYKCCEAKCLLQERFQIDVHCGLVPDYFTHGSHDHPLFISTHYKGNNKICCNGCKEICTQSYLQCSVCKFSLCYQCATIPNEISYKYDNHPLWLCCGERRDEDGMCYWCEVCEKRVNPTDWFYTCNECCTTIHTHCVVGPSVYLMPGFVFKYDPYMKPYEVFRNSISTRPRCDKCGHRCPSSVFYSDESYTKASCSLNCLDPRSRPLPLKDIPQAPVSDRENVLYVISCLDEKYDHIMNVIMDQKPFPSYKEAIDMLQLEEARMKKPYKRYASRTENASSSTAPRATDNPQRQQSKTRWNRRRCKNWNMPEPCWNPHYHNWQQPPREPASESHEAHMDANMYQPTRDFADAFNTVTLTEPSANLYTDSGASSHLASAPGSLVSEHNTPQ